MFRALYNFVYYILFIGIVAVAALLVASFFPFENWYQVKVVLSGSMEPAIPVGSVVVIKPSGPYQAGDVITFGRDTRTQIPVTHRITEVVSESRASQTFRTKGDANSDADPSVVSSREVIGGLQFTIPYLGYVLEFAKTRAGFITLVIIPSVLIALGELYKIGKEVVALRRKRRQNMTPELHV